MLDETFHLTPLDVRRYDFGRALRGYDPERVDQFREQVAEELERLTRLNQDLEAKAKGFHEQLRAFRERDKALNDALVSAQQLRGEIAEQAEREGQLIVREAHAEAERLLDDERHELRGLEQELVALERTRRTYAAQLRALVERQLAEFDGHRADGGRRPVARIARGRLTGHRMTTLAAPSADPTPAMRVDAAAEAIRARFPRRPDAAIILGTGLARLAEEIAVEAAIPYADIPGFPEPTVESHRGRLLCGTLGGRTVLAMQGRFHRYEGYTMAAGDVSGAGAARAGRADAHRVERVRRDASRLGSRAT